MPAGYFITFEGLDGSGKSTQLQRLYSTLAARGLPVVQTRQPGGTPLGERIRSLLLDSRESDSRESDSQESNPAGTLAPLAELALMFADRAQAIQEVIRPALDRGDLVLCDRFTDSSEAYQGYGRELGADRILTLHRQICGNLQPDLTILLLPSLDLSLERARRRNRRHVERLGTDENRFEREGDEFYRRVHSAYERIATRDATRVLTIKGDASIRDIEAEVLHAVWSRLAERVPLPV